MKKILLAGALLTAAFSQAFSQTETNTVELQRLSAKFQAEWNANRAEVLDYAKQNNLPVRIENDSITMEMQYIDQFGMPQYYSTDNVVAAASIGTNRVNSSGDAGYSLDGSGMTIYEWDGGGVQDNHQEFGARVIQGDNPLSLNYHSTHVAGTMMAAGAVPNAKGMASQAELQAYDWDYDNSEMAAAAAAGALISNHSYGYSRGWVWNGTGWDWYGNTGISSVEDYLFGFYDSNSAAWDEIAYNAPYFLICKSAGNDRGDGPGTTPSTAEKDGGDDGFDCIGQQGVSKNILTVGAVEDIPNGYEQPSDVVMSSFSSWGPADDGRIKPDIVANGVGLYSSYYNSDDPTATNYYASLNGTSMASPSAAGSLLLLQEHYEDLNGTGIYMKSATLKGLVIHTADEAGPYDGPDYMFGWGLLNIKAAADKITEDQTSEVILEENLPNNGTFTKNITATSGVPIKVTIVWTDRKGTPTTAQLNPSNAMLVRDLDLRVEGNTSGTTYYPWKLDRNNPSNAATNSGENNIDNVEVVYIENPNGGETYTITVDHDGNNTGGQDFSIIISAYEQQPEAKFAADITTAGLNEQVSFTDLSINQPTSWSWSISPATFNYVNSTSSSSQDIDVEFTDEGSYTVTLYVQNANGNDTKVKTEYITVIDAPTGYCEAYSTGPAGNIESFSFGLISNNNSGYTNIGSDDPDDKYYQDFTSTIIHVNLLQTYSLYVLNGYDGVNENLLDLAVWIDYNRDGDFDDTGEQVVCDPDNYGEGTFDITIPATAQLGATRLRVKTKYSGSDCGSPCGSTLNGEVEDYTLYIGPETYCAAGGGGDEYISGVILNTLSNIGTTADGYKNYTNLSTDLDLLGNYNITITNGTAYSSDDLGVWIDWNQDDDYDDVGENVVCDVDNGGQGTFSFTVPSDASLGITNMRVRIKYDGTDCGSPCGITTYGEVEDYSLNIRAGTLTWDGTESTDWDDPDNWDGGIVPTNSFNVVIPNDALVPNSPVIGAATTATCANCTLDTGADLRINGILTLSLP